MNKEKWDIRFLKLAEHVSTWSKDPSTKVGAVIVNPETKQVVGLGYNGFARGVKDTEERLNYRPTKYAMIVHAEINAILNATSSVKGCTLYTWPTLMKPNVCNDCCKAVINAGIKRVVCYNKKYVSERWKDQEEISNIMFYEAGVKIDFVDDLTYSS